MKNEILEFERYLQIEKGYPESTIKTYLDALYDFQELMNIENINSVDKSTIREYLYKLKTEKNNSASTRNKKLSAIRTFFGFLYSEDIINTDPTVGIQNSKLERKLPNILSKDEIIKLFENIKDNTLKELRDKTIIELFFTTGMRISELANIKLRDINFKSKYIIIHGKGQKQRHNPLDDNVIATILKYLMKRKEKLINSPYLFYGKDYNKPLNDSTIRRIVYKYAKKAGIKLKPHTIRHTFATYLCNNNADIRVIQELLGHADIRSTQIYTKVNNELIRQTYNKCFNREALGIK